MKFWLAFTRGRFPLAILAGIIWALAFPKPGVAGLAWIAPALLCLSAAGQRGWAVWRTGFVGGFIFYLVSLRWLLAIPLTGAPILGWIALSAYTAIYPATWVWLCWQFLPVTPLGRLETGAPENSLPRWRALASSMQSVSWLRRLNWTLGCAAAWAALEFLSSNFLGGFPWNLLGLSQYRMTPLIQLAASTGVWGVSFLIVWFSMSLLNVASCVVTKPGTRSAWVPEMILPLMVVVFVFGLGFHQSSVGTPPKRALKVLLIQPSIPQTVIWDSRESSRRFESLIRQTQQAMTNPNRPDLLIWPEAAVPKLLRYDAPTAEAVSDIARSNRVWMIVNADDAEPRPGNDSKQDADYFNSAFLLNPRGELVATYHKQRLVIFGEYVPFVRWLPFLKWLAPVEDYAAGRSPVPFELADLGLRTAVLICFEDMFPQSARQATDEETDFLVNLTNDGWFGEGSEQWQQAAGAVFRAVETRRPLIRCTNNGLTCWVDELGRIRELLDTTPRGVYGEGALLATVEFAGRESRGPSTLYHRYGDWFAWLCGLLTVGRLATGRVRRHAALGK